MDTTLDPRHTLGRIFGTDWTIANVAKLLRFNAAQGAVITAQGIGAAISTTLAGLVVVHAGYSAAFLTLAGVATIGLLLFLFAMPETKEQGEPDRKGNAARRGEGSATAARSAGIAAE